MSIYNGIVCSPGFSRPGVPMTKCLAMRIPAEAGTTNPYLPFKCASIHASVFSHISGE